MTHVPLHMQVRTATRPQPVIAALLQLEAALRPQAFSPAWHGKVLRPPVSAPKPITNPATPGLSNGAGQAGTAATPAAITAAGAVGDKATTSAPATDATPANGSLRLANGLPSEAAPGSRAATPSSSSEAKGKGKAIEKVSSNATGKEKSVDRHGSAGGFMSLP